MSELVTLERIGKVLLITLNRPEARNAINLETAQALAQALDEFDADPSIAVGVLTGANNTFCAGMDLKAFAKTGQRPYVGDRGFAGICERPPAKPLIAAVEGYCLAGGFEIALSCDLIVAADSANFGLPEVKRGIVPGSGGMVRLPSRIPYHMAMEMVLTGGMYPAARMAELGLVSRLAERGKTTEQALALAEQIAANGPLAVQTAKSIISQSRDWRQSDLFDLQRPRIAGIFTSADAKEGATAFAEKREPVWQGK
ncbi:crotonase/enoyl-CoA hydratase family protein [Alcaligenes phenolicus]|uniref:crotonase/enoyl-CoA hydratase family protein n=1 Tax=Alcaligenes phenolicus TaxID=232846 RepID=UPI002AA71EF9|nr:crotonase/enoyl-CoA hydratase family protein [Alcaligenes phenolicus]